MTTKKEKKKVYLNRQEILNNIKKIEYRNTCFSKLKRRIAKIFPESWIQAHFYKRFSAGLYLKSRYDAKDFYSPTEIVLDDKNPLICCEKIGVGSWSSSSLNKFSVKEFRNFIEVDRDFVTQRLQELSDDYKNNIESLRKRATEILLNGDLAK